jgi:hypothetical protein
MNSFNRADSHTSPPPSTPGTAKNNAVVVQFRSSSSHTCMIYTRWDLKLPLPQSQYELPTQEEKTKRRVHHIPSSTKAFYASGPVLNSLTFI